MTQGGSFSGEKGQIIEWEKESSDRPILHGSFDDWLKTQIYLIQNEVEIEEDEGYEEITEMMECSAEDFSKLNPGYPKRDNVS